MAQTVILTQSAYKELIARLTRIEKTLTNLVSLPEKEPTQGSDEWWQWSDKKAMEDIKTGRTKSFSSMTELIAELHK